MHPSAPCAGRRRSRFHRWENGQARPSAQRDAILKRLAGTLKKTTKRKQMPNGRVEEIEALETEGGILHCGRESGPDLDWFRAEIRRAYGGRAPKVLDPSPVVGPSRWRRCAWVARSRPWTSTRWPGSS